MSTRGRCLVLIVLVLALAGWRVGGLLAARVALVIAPAARTLHVNAGTPFAVQDAGGTVWCVSSHAGHTFLPFTMAADPTSGDSQEQIVRPWLPFLVQDHPGVSLCVSDHAGQALPPYVVSP